MVEPGFWSSNKFELWVAALAVNSNWMGELEGAKAAEWATASNVLWKLFQSPEMGRWMCFQYVRN